MFELNNFLLISLIFTVSVSKSVPKNKSFKDTTDETFQEECKSSANKYRQKHHAQDVENEQMVVDYAKKRCKVISTKKKLTHGTDDVDKDYGENQYWKSSGRTPCSEPIVYWYNTSESYNYEKPENSENADYFTQLVWKSTTIMGCARCKRADTTYVVCNFLPGGNMEGEFKENVSEP